MQYAESQCTASEMLNSRPPNRSIAIPQPAPIQIKGRVVANGILRRELLIHVDAKTGLFVAPHHSVAQFGSAGENLAKRVGKVWIFLNAKIPRREINMKVRGVADG